MFEKYTAEVLGFYELKKANLEMSFNLLHPTPAKLKNECVMHFDKGCQKNDLFLLRTLMKWSKDEEPNVMNVRRIDPDKFKPLINFLRKKTGPNENNVELLAWLIDYPLRPYLKYADANFVKKQPKSDHVMLRRTIVESPCFTSPLSDFATAENQKCFIQGFGIRTSIEGRRFERQRISENRTKAQSRLLPTTDSPVEHDFKSNGRECSDKRIVIEYPSGVRIMLESDNLEIISNLIKLK